MNAIVIGLGSMGRRRIRLLQSLRPEICIFGVDESSDRREQAEDELKIQTYSSIDSVDEKLKIDLAFVSTPPLTHSELISKCLKMNANVFSEINLVDTGYDFNISLANDVRKTLFLSSTFLYRKEIQYIVDKVKKSDSKLSYIYHTGQYLPDWHPWENYKDFFAGHKATNGCREIMAIEFPWIIKTFGRIKSIWSVGYNNSTLKLDFYDSYHIVIEHESGHRGLIDVDIVSRKATRNFELFGEDMYLQWDGTPNGLLVYDIDEKADRVINLYGSVEQNPDYSSSIIENAYSSEIENFLKVVDGAESPLYSFEEDKYVLSVINSIENDNNSFAEV